MPFTSDIYVRSEQRPLSLEPRSISKEALSAKLKFIYAERYLGFILLHAFALVRRPLASDRICSTIIMTLPAWRSRSGQHLYCTIMACAAPHGYRSSMSSNCGVSLPLTCCTLLPCDCLHWTQFVCPLYFSWRNLGLGMLVWHINVIGINMSYHRQLTHRSFKSSKWLVRDDGVLSLGCSNLHWNVDSDMQWSCKIHCFLCVNQVWVLAVCEVCSKNHHS